MSASMRRTFTERRAPRCGWASLSAWMRKGAAEHRAPRRGGVSTSTECLNSEEPHWGLDAEETHGAPSASMREGLAERRNAEELRRELHCCRLDGRHRASRCRRTALCTEPRKGASRASPGTERHQGRR